MLINEGRYKEAEDLVQEQDLDPMVILLIPIVVTSNNNILDDIM